MKTKLLFLFFSVMLLQVNMSVSAMVMKDGHRILLKDIKASGSHRSMPVLPAAFIDGSLLSVDFLYSVGSATITVKNSETGEIVYSSTDLNVTTLQIDLTGEDVGEYSLKLVSEIRFYQVILFLNINEKLMVVVNRRTR